MFYAITTHTIVVKFSSSLHFFSFVFLFYLRITHTAINIIIIIHSIHNSLPFSSTLLFAFAKNFENFLSLVPTTENHFTSKFSFISTEISRRSTIYLIIIVIVICLVVEKEQKEKQKTKISTESQTTTNRIDKNLHCCATGCSRILCVSVSFVSYDICICLLLFVASS